MVGGLRPEVPEDMPENLATLMCACWAGDANKRPSFAVVEKQLLAISEEGPAEFRAPSSV